MQLLMLYRLEKLGLVSANATPKQTILDIIVSVSLALMALVVLLLSPYPWPWGIGLADDCSPLLYKVLACALIPVIYMLIGIFWQKRQIKKFGKDYVKPYSVSVPLAALTLICFGVQTYFLIEVFVNRFVNR